MNFKSKGKRVYVAGHRGMVGSALVRGVPRGWNLHRHSDVSLKRRPRCSVPMTRSASLIGTHRTNCLAYPKPSAQP
jgi:hypothetical protein